MHAARALGAGAVSARAVGAALVDDPGWAYRHSRWWLGIARGQRRNG